MINENRYNIILSVVVLFLASLLIFFRLGEYALWDDEATTALFAEAVWHTGDTNAQVGHNIVAYNSGVELDNMHNRVMPPLSFYLAAPFVGINSGSSFAARLPFAICGFLTIIMVFVWLKRAKVSFHIWTLMSMGLLGNVSLILFFRQCRYYAPVILFSVIIAYIYYYRDNTKKSIFYLSFYSLLLLSANYLCYAGVMVCLSLDYLLFGRHKLKVSIGAVVTFLLSQIIIGGVLLSIYSPFGIDVWKVAETPWLKEKVTLFIWNIRELNSCEFGAGLLLLIAPVLALWKNNQLLLRCSLLLLIYIICISILSPQPLGLLSVAFVRYLIPTIPLCITISVMVIAHIQKRSIVLMYLVAIIAFFTNVFNGGSFAGADSKTMFSHVIGQGQLRSSFINYTGELINPPRSAYRLTSTWINENVLEEQLVWVTPGYAVYPLMFHSRKPIYMWQIDEYEEQFAHLSDFHFKGKGMPDYMIAFGVYRPLIEQKIMQYQAEGIKYELATHINQYWYDLTRPELMWHTFKSITNHEKDSEEIYIYRKVNE